MFEYFAKNERWIVLTGLALVAAAGLALTLHMGDVLMMSTPSPAGTTAYAVLLFAMWWAMMMAMMLPTAAPAILTFAAISRKFAAKSNATTSLSAFVAGYAAIWTAFSAVAVALQMAVSPVIELSMMMAVTSAVLGGGLLIAAGLYQMSPLKLACLRKCQMPLMYFSHHWRKGIGGAWRMGLSHGVYCLGCCWVLMGLLFYGGIMELRWIVGLAIYVAIEKLAPPKFMLSHLTGLVLVGWGGWTIFEALR